MILLQSLFESIIDARLGLGNSEGLFPYKHFSLSSSSSFGHHNGLKYFLKEHFHIYYTIAFSQDVYFKEFYATKL